MAAAKKAAGKQAITLHDHIKELRNRFFVVAAVLIVATTIAYNYKDTLIYWLLKPLGNEKLIYLNPAGGFSFIFQVTLYVGIAAAVPVLIYNLYRFVSPVLPAGARKHSVLVMASSLLLLCVGVGFGYIFAIPGALNFLNNFAEGYVLPSLTADSYLNFILAYTAGLGILFQLPLALLLIHWIHPLKPKSLFKFERYMILIAFVGAAMITPTPDIMNQLVIALPIILMYQAGVIAICISIARAKRRALPPKLSRAQRKAQRKAAKLTRKAPQPAMMPAIPELSTLPTLPAPPTLPGLTIMPTSATVVRPTPARVTLPQPTLQQHNMAPAPKPPHTLQPVLPHVTPAVTKPSQTRRSMDIMMAPGQAVSPSRGGITLAARPAHQPRTPTLQVPQRIRSSLPSIDGISVIY